MIIKCKCCGKKPEEIKEYVECAKDYECTPEEYVIKEEGTLNIFTGNFYCTECYISIGMPLGKA